MRATDLETHLPPERDTPAPVVTRDPHPLRPKPALPELVPFASSTTAGVDQGGFGSSGTGPTAHEPLAPVAAADAETDRPHGDLPGYEFSEPRYEDAARQQPADDYKLEMPSTPDHDLPLHDAPAHDQSFDQPRVDNESLDVSRPTVPPKTDDWLDRALADIDEELPLHAPAPRSPTASPTPPERPAAEPIPPAPVPMPPAIMPPAIVPPAPVPELAMANAEPLHAGADHVEATTAMPSPPEPASAVIGRYEADGTSYVMYADGSIEAQSSAGVYRFSSMAELKSFIEH